MNRLLCVALSLVAVTSLAQTPEFVSAQNPAPINALELDGGYRIELSDAEDADDTSYYKVSYRGSLVTSQGTPFKNARGLDLAAPELPEGTGDRNRWSLRLEDGSASGDGGIFEAEAVAPLVTRGIEKLNLRGTALVTGLTDGGQIRFAAGLETRPFRIPGLRGREITNWIVFGVNGQRNEGTDDAVTDDSFALLTARVFAGKAFGWRKSADVGQTAARIRDAFMREAPTFARAQAIAKEIRGLAHQTDIQQVFLDAVDNATGDNDWPQQVQSTAMGHADAITDQATFAAYAEFSGWYALQEVAGEGRIKSLFTASLDYWFLPQRDDVFLRGRYELGYERAAPTTRLNRVSFSLAARF